MTKRFRIILLLTQLQNFIWAEVRAFAHRTLAVLKLPTFNQGCQSANCTSPMTKASMLVPKRVLQLALLSACFFSIGAVQAHNSKKYNLSICAIFKNEANYLKEWIEYHRLVGVDHFYLYNNGSTDNFKNVLNPYIKKGHVTLINWPDCLTHQDEENVFIRVLGTQIPAYENAAKFRTVKETKWLVFADINEFLVPSNTSKLTEVLERYREYPGVTLMCDYFDASKVDTLPKRKLLIETLELTHAPKQNLQKQVKKTIFKPDLCEGFTWPPYACIFKNHQSAVTVGKQELRINYYAYRNEGYSPFRKMKDKLHVDNRMLTDHEMTELLECGYEIEDQDRVIYRFLPDLLKKMGFDPGWG